MQNRTSLQSWSFNILKTTCMFNPLKLKCSQQKLTKFVHIQVQIFYFIILQYQYLINCNYYMEQKKIIHKGIYISNQRKKGYGGRIKSTQFPNKIQVFYKNAAIHQSQVQWVQVRRYIKGDNKKDNKQKQKGQKQKNTKKQLEKTKSKFVEKKTQQKQKITQVQTQSQIKQKSLSELAQIKQVRIDKVQKEIKCQKQIDQNVNYQNSNQNVNCQNSSQHVNQQNSSQNVNCSNSIQNGNDQNQNQMQVNEREQNQQSDAQNNQVSKQSNQIEQQKQNKQQSKKSQEKQEIIVAQIVKQTNIVYKQKKFVGILTCTKKKNSKGSYIQKNIGPIQHIIKDYFLDLEPIHSRLPKMEVDILQKNNIKVLTQYVESFFPQKGKQLTKSKLNKILDLIQSVYVIATFSLFDKADNAYSNIHQVIGKTYTIDGECDCFLYQHQLNGFTYQPTQQQKLKQTVKLQLTPSQHHIKFNKMVFSIDPATSIDLDDALSIQQINQDLYQIGIHISDVSEYLKYISRDQLIKRTTSVYLPHRVFHMIPNNIVEICSLNPNVQRLAFTIFVRMNLKGEIIGQTRLEKNIIKSRFKLSYEIVQDIITAKTNYQIFSTKYECSVEQFQTLADKLGTLTLIATAHRQKRVIFQVFQNKEISFSLDQNRWPIQLNIETRFTAKKVVQQYMIIGNIQAAKKLIQNFAQNALIIYHPKPTELSMKYFNENFKFLNTIFQFEDILKVQQELKRIKDDQKIQKQVKQFLFFKARRVQQAANYRLHHQVIAELKNNLNLKQEDKLELKNIHFALGQQYYTHFTSPMRRLADILVHQTLSSLIYKVEPKKVESQVIQKINNGRRHTKRLKKDINQMYICLMIYKTHKIIQDYGIVISFGLKSISIYLPLFDMMKQLMWKDQLQVHKVRKSNTDPQVLDVCVYFDKRNSSKDINWKVKKFDRVKVFLDCTKKPPLRLSITLQVDTKKGKQKVYAINPES